MKAIGLSPDLSYKGNNPLPWLDKHFSNTNTQVAPQEVEISSYLSASILNDMNEAKLSDVWNEKLDV